MEGCFYLDEESNRLTIVVSNDEGVKRTTVYLRDGRDVWRVKQLSLFDDNFQFHRDRDSEIKSPL